ncbi:MAG TPA: hypothetical protein VKR52_04400 [Terracidiphilus sp.]|nr:hypothetical protein [Terracidiphilus sp.]
MANRSGVWRCGICVFVLTFGVIAFRAQAQETSPSGAAGAGVAASKAGVPNRDQKITGVAVIIKVDSAGENPVFEADGYRIRMATNPATPITFAGKLKTLADVEPDTWIRFEGVRDQSGTVVAQSAHFYPSGSRKVLTVMGPKKMKREPDYQPVTQESLLDADGHLVSAHTKVRLSDSGGPCGWHRVPADASLQERVRRVGMKVLPEYQKQLPQGAPSRIPFRFYAVTDDRVRSAIACNEGLILVPRNVLELLKSDEQLAAVLADAVAFHLVRQLSTLTPAQLGTDVGAEAVSMIPALFPAGYIAGESVAGLLNYEQRARVHRECARIALQLMADAGYDPWQAPEAWRALARKDVPTPEGKYQLDVLNRQYRKTGNGNGR